MVRLLVEKPFNGSLKYCEFAGLAEDTMPTAGVVTGSKYTAVDTGDTYLFDEESSEWTKVPPDPEE